MVILPGYQEDGEHLGNVWSRPDPYLLQQYRTKYGTLSSGSALCKSMKYAEPWLYGSVSSRRPHAPPMLLPLTLLCSCPEFLSGTHSRSGKLPPSACKKCGGSRTAWGTPGPPGGTVRLAPSAARPSIFGGGTAREPPPPSQPPAAPDPYDLMRRSRLGSVTPTDPPSRMSAYEPRRARAKSSSPSRRRAPRRDPSPPLAAPAPSTAGRASRRDLASWGEPSPDPGKRKSILECDVNAYELIAKYLKGGGTRGEGLTEDELSDDLNDDVLDDPAPEKTPVQLPRRSGGVTIAGQTVRVFSDVPKDVGDPPAGARREPQGEDRVPRSPSMIPRLASPRRPPRRQKHHHHHQASGAAPRETSTIKSILKKRAAAASSSSSSASAAARTFNDTVSKPDRGAPGRGSPLPAPGFHLPTFQEYRQQNRRKKQVQFKVGDEPGRQHRAAPSSQVDDDDDDQPGRDEHARGEVVLDATDADRPPSLRGRLRGGASECAPTAEGLRTPPPSGDDVLQAGGSERDLVVAERPESAIYISQYGVGRERAEPGEAVTLRRSLSDRLSTPHPSLQLVGGRHSALFNDTMRLRFQPAARRPDARQVFASPGPQRPAKAPTAPGRPPRLLSPVRSRPREPPPPPPDKLPEPPPRQASKRAAASVEPEVPDDASPPPDASKARPSSWSPPHLATHDTVEALEIFAMREHRLSDPTLRLRVATPDSVPVERPDQEIRTVVAVAPPPQGDVHRLEVRTGVGDQACPWQARTSIVINGDDVPPHVGSTSVVIGDDRGVVADLNRVTISVGGVPGMHRSSSRTFIDARCQPADVDDQSSFVATPPTATVIPVSSPSPQSTLVVLEHRSTVEVSGVVGDLTKDEPLEPRSPTNRRVVADESKSLLDDESAILDPVEAVKRNLVPHVCGRDADDDNVSLLSEKLKEDFYLVTPAISRCFDGRPSRDHVEVPEALVETTEEEDEDDITDDEEYELCPTTPDHFDDDGSSSVKDEADDPFPPCSPLSRPRFVVEEKDTQEEEEEDEEVENMYESINDHIYEEIGDAPPPLPLSPPPSLDEGKRCSRSIFEGASKYDILSYLEGAKERGIVPEDCYYSGGSTAGDPDDKALVHGSLDLGDLSSRVSHLSNNSDSSEDSCNLIITSTDDETCPDKVRKSSAEIERNDSGVGSETSKSSRSRWQQHGPALSIREDQLQHLCEDCDQPVETQVTDSGLMFAPLVCRKCGKKRAERKETIAEIVETEEKYGRDLRIILDEFYRPMLVAGLLTADQLQAIFLNAEELLEHNAALAEKLRDALEIALEQGDEDLLTVNIGRLFLEAAPMLHAFESYCTRQAAASLLLANLEKEKELLRIFLKVSQMENTVLRRMNLNSFLMVPVQRVTKYPLLLARLYKVTPSHHEGRELLKEAQHKIELHLEHMNEEAKDVTSTKIWRRISIMNSRRSTGEADIINIKLRKMALDVLEWNHDEARFVMEGKLLYTNPTDNNWRRGRTVKLNAISAMLITNGKPSEEPKTDLSLDEALLFPRKSGVREATLMLLKDKGGRYTLIREPLYLDKCIVCCEADWEDYFEVQELASKDTFIFKAEDGEKTKAWFRQIQHHAQGLGAWRKRRNALANIMINGMLTRN